MAFLPDYTAFADDIFAWRSVFGELVRKSTPVTGDGISSPALMIVGLRDEWHDKASSEMLKSSTMIIREPNKFVA
jgi:hypothetical protein